MHSIYLVTRTKIAHQQMNKYMLDNLDLQSASLEFIQTDLRYINIWLSFENIGVLELRPLALAWKKKI